MYYQLSEFYKRDIYFEYDNEKSPIQNNNFNCGEELEVSKPLVFNIDKLDNYIGNYDILPTFNTPLVSQKFAAIFQELVDAKQIQFIKTSIFDEKGNENKNFLLLNILNIIPCMDKKNSIIETKTYGEAVLMNIKKLYILPNSLNNLSLIRMEEKKSYIIVSEDFKKRCEEAKLKGIEFIEEGHSIYTDL
ncbi:hypothetical protein CXF68_13230 [Tenacibaculum sp. Bg11-29]|uniref:imm11 family protein n=1 Tax=Tenacibaculum sp. Bg11-29 TaxID=2058306 RepID=UPI000C32F3AD|nr:DUF1629 domain-containing protein [Tenacibaculum sp. Bg11-29]PKH53050.1 hypothetical protein CXF68_13230 [Tenacibaculum sp. Bg11-29]